MAPPISSAPEQAQDPKTKTAVPIALPTPLTALNLPPALTGAAPETRDRLRLGVNPSSRTIYVVMAGMNDPESHGAQAIRDRLVQNGVPKDQVLIPSNPCPSFTKDAKQNFERFGVDPSNPTLRLFARNMDLYMDYTRAQSAESQRSFQEITKLLGGVEFNPASGDRLVFVGHSLGGQRAVTMTELAETHGLPVHNVITLGTPLHRNNTRRTNITHITSDGDAVMTGVLPLPSVSVSLSKTARVLKTPPSVSHEGYFKDEKVFNTVVVKAIIEPTGESHKWNDFDGAKQTAKSKVKEAYANTVVAAESLGSRVAGAVRVRGAAIAYSAENLGRSLINYSLASVRFSMR